MKCQRYWIAISLIAVGVTFSQAQTQTAVLTCGSSAGATAIDLIAYNLPETPPPPGAPSTGGATSPSGFLQGYVDAALEPDLAAILANGSALPQFVTCVLAPLTPPTTWQAEMKSVAVTSVQLLNVSSAQGGSAPPQPFVRIAVEYSGINLMFTNSNEPIITAYPPPPQAPPPPPIPPLPEAPIAQPSGGGAPSSSTGPASLTAPLPAPAPTSGLGATPAG